MEANPRDKVCSTCSNLRLTEALEKVDRCEGISRADPIHVADVGFKYRQPPTTDCALCTILFASRILPKASLAASEHGDQILLFDSYMSDSGLLHPIIAIAWILDCRPPDDCAYIVVAPFDYYHVSRITSQPHIQRQGVAAIHRSHHPGESPLRAVSASFDANMASCWLYYCREHHTERCGHQNEPLVSGLRLIDCTDLSIIEAGPDKPYVALSYVWGSPSNVDNKVRLVEKRLMLPARPSNVIMDAISVTKALGFQYLWVDKFCIIQDNKDIRHDQIKQMRFIYENADLTIVAAAGADETYGLPGVGQRKRTPQLTARVDGMQVMLTKKDAQMSIRSSRWSSRGWTFQEGVLSRRRLVFTEEQMYFECNTTNCSESIHSPLDTMHVKNKSRQHQYMRAGMFAIGREDDLLERNFPPMSLNDVFNQYWSAIQDYTSRDLSYDADSLNAFQGIIERYALNHDINASWGLPYPVLQDIRTGYFTLSLSWYHAKSCWKDSRQPRRRPAFPSWTWAGWAGAVQVKIAQTYSMRRFRNGVQAVQFGARGISAKDLGLLNSSIPESQCSVIHLLAKPLPSSLFSYQSADEIKGWRLIGTYRPELFASSNRVLEAQLERGLEDVEQWQCIWICTQDWHSVVMVLERSQNTRTWTRAGIFIMNAAYWDAEQVMEGIDAAWYEIE